MVLRIKYNTYCNLAFRKWCNKRGYERPVKFLLSNRKNNFN
jgi:hypothetical protein